MITIENNKGDLGFEFKGKTSDISAEFSQVCLEGCEKVGKMLEDNGTVPEGAGSMSLLADMVVGFALKRVGMFNPLDLFALGESGKVKNFHVKVVEFVNSLAEDMEAEKENCTEEERAKALLAKLFGVDLDDIDVDIEVLNIDGQEQTDGDPDGEK